MKRKVMRGVSPGIITSLFILLLMLPWGAAYAVDGDISASFTDPNFKQAVWEWLGHTGTPGAFTQQDLIDRVSSKDSMLALNDRDISSLAGLENFEGTGLEQFDCGFNQLSSLPELPSSLTYLSCGSNQLESLPSLPSSLKNLSCSSNQLSSLPNLPPSLIILECDFNQLSNLPELPGNLWWLYCNSNRLSSLPSLPSSIQYLFCDENFLNVFSGPLKDMIDSCPLYSYSLAPQNRYHYPGATIQLKPGETLQLIGAELQEESSSNGTDWKKDSQGAIDAFTFFTSDEAVAKVSSGGLITAKGEGSCNIHALFGNADSEYTKVLIPVMVTEEAEPPITVTLSDDKELVFDVSPVLENGRVLVPFRAISEALGATVDWDSAAGTVTAIKGNTTIKLTVGNRTAYRNDSPMELDVPARIVNGRTLVPIRFFSEALGARVDWDNVARHISIWPSPPKPGILGYISRAWSGDDAVFVGFKDINRLGKVSKQGNLEWAKDMDSDPIDFLFNPDGNGGAWVIKNDSGMFWHIREDGETISSYRFPPYSTRGLFIPLGERALGLIDDELWRFDPDGTNEVIYHATSLFMAAQFTKSGNLLFQENPWTITMIDPAGKVKFNLSTAYSGYGWCSFVPTLDGKYYLNLGNKLDPQRSLSLLSEDGDILWEKPGHDWVAGVNHLNLPFYYDENNQRYYELEKGERSELDNTSYPNEYLAPDGNRYASDSLTFYALDDMGKVRWNIACKEADQNIIFSPDGSKIYRRDNGLKAIYTYSKEGDVLWEYQLPEGGGGLLVDENGHAFVDKQGNLYILTDGRLLCLDETGKVRWEAGKD